MKRGRHRRASSFFALMCVGAAIEGLLACQDFSSLLAVVEDRGVEAEQRRAAELDILETARLGDLQLLFDHLDDPVPAVYPPLSIEELEAALNGEPAPDYSADPAYDVPALDVWPAHASAGRPNGVWIGGPVPVGIQIAHTRVRIFVALCARSEGEPGFNAILTELFEEASREPNEMQVRALNAACQELELRHAEEVLKSIAAGDSLPVEIRVEAIGTLVNKATSIGSRDNDVVSEMAQFLWQHRTSELARLSVQRIGWIPVWNRRFALLLVDRYLWTRQTSTARLSDQIDAARSLLKYVDRSLYPIPTEEFNARDPEWVELLLERADQWVDAHQQDLEQSAAGDQSD